MKYKRLGNVVIALFASAVSWVTVNGISPVEVEAEEVRADKPADVQLQEKVSNSSTDDSSSIAVKVGEPASDQSKVSKTATSTAIAKVFSHTLDSRPAATLYVRDIPVLTFLGQESSPSTTAAEAVTPATQDTKDATETRKLAAGKAENSAENSHDPLWKASQIAARLNQLGRSGEVDARKISVKWDDEKYLVQMGDDTLVTLDEQVILPDSTGTRTEDALQATNRFRRLLGQSAAEPLKVVANLPKAVSKPAMVAAAGSFYQKGWASWYGPGFHGNQSASGEVFNQYAMTAAHRYLPFGTLVRVTNLNNGSAVTVRINDRGPYAGDRVIDLSAGAADYIGLTNAGVAPVRLDVLN